MVAVLSSLVLALFGTAMASDTVHTLTLEELVQRAPLVLRVKPTAPPTSPISFEAPLGTDPPSTTTYTQYVRNYAVVSAIRKPAGLDLPARIQTMASNDDSQYDRTLDHEAGAKARGIIHRRYKNSLDDNADLTGTALILFAAPPGPMGGREGPRWSVWTEHVGHVYTEHGRDALTIEDRVHRLIADQGAP